MPSRRTLALATAAAAVVVAIVVVLIVRSSAHPTAAATTGPPTVSTEAAQTSAPEPDPVETDEGPAWAEDGAALEDSVGLRATAVAGTGVRGTLVSVTRVDAQANGPGETSGPAVQVEVRLDNRGTSALDLDQVVVDVYGADGSPGQHYVYSTSVSPLTGALGVGKSATGTYLVGLPSTEPDSVVVVVTYAGGQPALVFQGTV